MRILRVRGDGRVSRSPDLIVFSFTITSLNVVYDKAMDDLNNRTAFLIQDIIKAGFTRDDLKTTNFSVNTEYKYQNGDNVFLGYKAIHELKLEFAYNQNILNNLLRILSDSKSEALYIINFEVKDKQSFKNEVLKDAVNNAGQNASVIADTASIKLGKILNINYEDRDIVYRSKAYLEDTMVKTSAIDIVPEDVQGTDSVIIEWESEDII